MRALEHLRWEWYFLILNDEAGPVVLLYLSEAWNKTRLFRCIWSIHPFSKDPFPMQALVSERILESIVLKSSHQKRSKMMFSPTGFVASNPWAQGVFSCRVFLLSSYKANTISHEKKDAQKRPTLSKQYLTWWCWYTHLHRDSGSYKYDIPGNQPV